jgi:fumarylacetoacetase-like protein
MTLLPGDIISTGTPAGVGLGMKPPQYLKAGDVVDLGIEGLGQSQQHGTTLCEDGLTSEWEVVFPHRRPPICFRIHESKSECTTFSSSIPETTS